MATQDLISGKDFCRHHHIEITFLQSLHDYGLLEIITTEEDYFLQPDQLGEVEKLVRLHYDLQVNFEGIDVIRNLLGQMESMQAEIDHLKSRLKLYGPHR